MTIKRKYQSEAFEAIHSSARAHEEFCGPPVEPRSKDMALFRSAPRK